MCSFCILNSWLVDFPDRIIRVTDRLYWILMYEKYFCCYIYF